MAKKEESSLFVGISDGADLRRSMLECSKGILETLKDHENFKLLRKEKGRLISRFKAEIKDITKLMNCLRGCMPKVKDATLKMPEAKKAEEPKRDIRTEKRHHRTELEKLEEELNDIEDKLNSLG
ncbi:hypothetical protein KY358_06200 [Candidatus Woesearchaeota archaeon]|nr:hypothetical protein [Candidatus Woesearchaeota archaeon]